MFKKIKKFGGWLFIGLLSISVFSPGYSSLTKAQVAPSQTEWKVGIETYVGTVGLPPQDTMQKIGVKPGATDNYDINFDYIKPGEPMGAHVWTWFNRPSWGQGPIMIDKRPEIDEGTSKTWGSADSGGQFNGTKVIWSWPSHGQYVSRFVTFRVRVL